MATVRGTLVVLNYIYLVLGIFGLLMALLQSHLLCVLSFAYLLNSVHSSIALNVSWIVLVLTFCGFLLGRMAMKENRSDKMRHFAAFVFVCFVLQVVAESYLYACRPDPAMIVQTIKQEFIVKFNTIPNELQTCIQETQQNARCCGISSWKEFDPKYYRPDSCCGRYSPSTGSVVGHCIGSELDKVPGCKDYYYQMMRTPFGLHVFQTVSYGIQLLLSILAFIQSRRLLKQNYLNASEQTPLLTE